MNRNVPFSHDSTQWLGCSKLGPYSSIQIFRIRSIPACRQRPAVGWPSTRQDDYNSATSLVVPARCTQPLQADCPAPPASWQWWRCLSSPGCKCRRPGTTMPRTTTSPSACCVRVPPTPRCRALPPCFRGRQRIPCKLFPHLPRPSGESPLSPRQEVPLPSPEPEYPRSNDFRSRQ